jgi:hypothetical protein
MTGRAAHASKFRAVAIALAGLVVCFHQVIVLVVGDVWPPVAMVHEIFGTNYFALAYRWITPFFIETGHGALALLAYPSYAVATLFGDAGNLFQRMTVFGVTFLLLVGTATFAIYCFVWRSLCRPREAFMLLCIPLAPLVLEPATVLNLIVNYTRAQEVIGMATAALFIARLAGWKEDKGCLVFAAGGLLGIAISVKFTNVMVFGPLLVAIALPRSALFSEIRKISFQFCFAAAVAFAAVIFIYVQMSWRLLVFDIDHLIDLYTVAGWVRQNTPFLISELLNLSLGSHYLALKAVLVAVIILLGSVAVGWRRQSAWTRRVVGTLLLPVPFLFWMLTARTALGTMLDIVVYVAILFVVLTSILSTGSVRFATAIIVGAMVVVTAAFVHVVDPTAVLRVLRQNSKLAMEIEALTRTSLPIVFYQAGAPQPVLFPSALQICIYKASASPAYKTLTAALCSSMREASPDQPLLPGRHVAIVPEYLVGLPDSPAITREWPQKWSKNVVNFAALDPTRRLDRGHCRVFQFQELSKAEKSLLYYSAYPTRVTVCRVDAADRNRDSR